MGDRILVFIGAHPDDETFGVGGTLAQYAADGVKVYYICATRGEAGSADTEKMEGFASFADMRWAEMECAAAVLGLVGVYCLGYRDSGMPGSEDNRHPGALINFPVAEVAGRMVRLIREIKPQVVITFDPIGGYRHPDHIATHNAAVKAFAAAGDPSQYPQAGVAFQPQRLYFHIFPRRFLKTVVRLLPLLGQDPRKFGRNKDIDLASLVHVEFPEHAVIRLRKQSIETRERARKCHASQSGGQSALSFLWRIANSLAARSDSYMRAYPEPYGNRRERDLFNDVT